MRLYTVFRPFGEICHFYGGYSGLKYQLVFKRAPSIDALKQIETIEIEGNKWKIRWSGDIYDHHTRPLGVYAPSLNTPPAQSSPNNILNALNNDCLRAIFEQDGLPIEDLCSLACTSQRLNSFGIEAFKRKHKMEPKKFVEKLADGAAIWQWEDYLSVFGKTVESINTKQNRNTNILIHLIEKYCPNITDLTCELNFRTNVEDLCSLFSRLDTLNVSLSQGIPFDSLIPSTADCKLKKLTIRSTSQKLTPKHLPNLIELNLICAHLQQESADAFFALNPQLKRLQIGKSLQALVSSSILSGLRNLPQLQQLKLFGSWAGDESAVVLSDVYDVLRGMRHLKQLTIGNNTIRSKSALQSMVRAIVEEQLPLEHFSLTAKAELSNIQDIGDIKTITSLHFCTSWLRDDEFIEIVESLPHLVDVQINSANITILGVRRFLRIVQPSMKARFDLGIQTVATALTQTIPSLASIDELSTTRGIQLAVRLPIDKDFNRTLIPVSAIFLLVI